MGPQQLNFMLVVDDGGELKSITRVELEAAGLDLIDFDYRVNEILDARAIAEGAYDPSTNDTPIVVTMDGDEPRDIFEGIPNG